MINQRDHFDYFFQPNINWMDDASIDVKNVLIGFYPQFFDAAKQPNYQLLKAGILNNDNKAKECFKALFKLPVKFDMSKFTDLLNLPAFKVIREEYGNAILAHGVEEAKGGMYNILMMCISNAVRVDGYAWGGLVEGLSNISALAHGPYYIILSTEAAINTKSSNKPSMLDVEYVLVPFDRNVEILTAFLSRLVLNEMLTKEHADSFQKKLITLEQLQNLLQSKNRNIKRKIDTSKPDAVSASTPKITKQENIFFASTKKSVNAASKPTDKLHKKTNKPTFGRR